jgi:histidinol-phosphate aminotransferase
VVFCGPTFPAYAIFAKACEAEILEIPARAGLDIDVEGLIAAAARGPDLLVLCTPNNPTGVALELAALEAILAATPRSTMVLVDEAYLEFDDLDSMAALSAWGGEWVSLRTFSKAYGLAGVRVGYLIASSPSVVEAIDRLRPHFNVGAMAQAAALAAFEDQAHLSAVVAKIVEERERLHRAIDAEGLWRTPSRANFVFIRTPGDPNLAAERLLAQGLIVRPVPPAQALRITVGRPEQNSRVIAALSELSADDLAGDPN